MTRPMPLLLIAAVLLAAGCGRDAAAPADGPAPPAGATAVPADAPAADAGVEPDGPAPEDLPPLTLPEPVIDPTPVDTVITTIDASNAATGTALTAPVRDDFATQDSVFLDIRTNGTAGRYTISSRWFYPDGELIAENSQIVTGAGPASTIFSMSKPDGWAPGTYRVEFSINGKLQQTKQFVVR